MYGISKHKIKKYIAIIRGEFNFLNTQQTQQQMKIDYDTKIFVTHHRLYLYIVLITATSHLSKNVYSTTLQIDNIKIRL